MRCDQHAGLPPNAPKIQCLLAAVGQYIGMSGIKYPLNWYSLYDGHCATEFVQADPWYSGPVFFLGLKTSDGKTYEWAEEEMQEYLGIGSNDNVLT